MIPVERRKNGEQPNATRYYDPEPEYLRDLIRRTGLSQNSTAQLIGVSGRSMRYYLSTTDRSNPAPYPVQVAMEELAAGET